MRMSSNLQKKVQAPQLNVNDNSINPRHGQAANSTKNFEENLGINAVN